MGEQVESRAVELELHGKRRIFDVDDPILPEWVEEKALSSGDFPYKKKMKSSDYMKELKSLQIELVKVQFWLQATGKRIMSIFEGRDAAGKGGAIFATSSHMNPRLARVVALSKPNDREAGQWYFQRYVDQFPTSGEFVLFDRSWYNRAGVEPVMGFCTPEQYEAFLHQAPQMEKVIDHEAILFFKFYLDIGREMQLKRFHDRRHDPRKVWKLSSMDIAALDKWDDYSKKARPDAEGHPYRLRALDRGACQRQAPGAAEPHPPYPDDARLYRQGPRGDRRDRRKDPRLRSCLPQIGGQPRLRARRFRAARGSHRY